MQRRLRLRQSNDGCPLVSPTGRLHETWPPVYGRWGHATFSTLPIGEARAQRDR